MVWVIAFVVMASDILFLDCNFLSFKIHELKSYHLNKYTPA